MYMMDACLKKCTVVLSIRKIRVSQVQNVHAHAEIVDVLLTSETVVDVLLTSTVDALLTSTVNALLTSTAEVLLTSVVGALLMSVVCMQLTTLALVYNQRCQCFEVVLATCRTALLLTNIVPGLQVKHNVLAMLVNLTAVGTHHLRTGSYSIVVHTACHTSQTHQRTSFMHKLHVL